MNTGGVNGGSPADLPRYPRREPFFALRCQRLFLHSRAAQALGLDALALLTAVVTTEDQTRYRGPVTFHNSQLQTLLGFGKWERLDAARKKLIAAGWLHYLPPSPGARQPGTYWAAIPAPLDDYPDLPAADQPDPLATAYHRGFADGQASCSPQPYPSAGDTPAGAYPANGYGQGDARGYGQGDARGEPSYLLLPPNPAPKEITPPALLALIDKWNTLPPEVSSRKAKRDPPARAVLKGWQRVQRDAEVRDLFDDPQAIIDAARRAKFCHAKGWFTLPWLFARNNRGESNITNLLEGAHDDATNGNRSTDRAAARTSAGQVYDAQAKEKDPGYGEW